MGNAAVIVGLLLLGRAAQHRLYAGNYLTGAEGFYDIIVGAQLEAQYAVYLLALCGKHYHGYARGLAYLAAHVIETEAYSNTAAAAKFIAETRPEGVGAVCSAQAAEEYGLEVIAADIQNTDNNCTRFIVISREAVLPEDAEKISLCFSLPHTPGSLCHTLERFALLGLNLTKIESRPIPERNFEYDFYLDFTGNVHDVQTLALICALSDEMPRFSFLGNYKES